MVSSPKSTLPETTIKPKENRRFKGIQKWIGFDGERLPVYGLRICVTVQWKASLSLAARGTVSRNRFATRIDKSSKTNKSATKRNCFDFRPLSAHTYPTDKIHIKMDCETVKTSIFLICPGLLLREYLKMIDHN